MYIPGLLLGHWKDRVIRHQPVCHQGQDGQIDVELSLLNDPLNIQLSIVRQLNHYKTAILILDLTNLTK